MKVRTVITLEYELDDDEVTATTKEEVEYIRDNGQDFDMIVNGAEIHLRSVEVTEID